MHRVKCSHGVVSRKLNAVCHVFVCTQVKESRKFKSNKQLNLERSLFSCFFSTAGVSTHTHFISHLFKKDLKGQDISTSVYGKPSDKALFLKSASIVGLI